MGKLSLSNDPIPIKLLNELRAKHLRIIWAIWHLASIFGWCIGAMLLNIALIPKELNPSFVALTIQTTSYAMFASSLLVLLGTKGKHPGWIVLMLIGILLIIGN